jgi:uncharacterized protein (DUF302 family)
MGAIIEAMTTTPNDPAYGMTARLKGVSYEDARARVADALKQEGFGVLTEIDIRATLKAKLDKEFRKYVILGACNPHLASRALDAELGIGLLLPCNVCVWEEEGGSVVSILRPDSMFALVDNAGMKAVAEEADQRLRRVIGQISQS